MSDSDDQSKHHFIKSINNLKLAYKIKFYGMNGCINCAFLFPLLSLADRAHYFEDVEIVHYPTKEEYKTEITNLLKNYSKRGKQLPVPVILIKKNAESAFFIVNPDTVSEVTVELMDSLNALGDLAVMAYMDGEVDMKTHFINLLIKLVSNIEPLDR